MDILSSYAELQEIMIAAAWGKIIIVIALCGLVKLIDVVYSRCKGEKD